MNSRLQGGYSLIELIVAATIITILTLSVSTFLVNAALGWTRTNTEAGLQADNQAALDAIGADLRKGSAVMTTNTITDLQTWTTAAAGPLVIAVPATSIGGGTIHLDSTYLCKNEVVYYIANSNLFRRTLANASTGCNSAAGNTAVTSCTPQAPNEVQDSCPDDARITGSIGFVNNIPATGGISSIGIVFEDLNACSADLPACDYLNLTINGSKSQYGKTYTLSSQSTAALGRVGVASLTYYFNSSDAAFSEQNSAIWTSEANAFDGQPITSYNPNHTGANGTTAGSTTLNWLKSEGTSAPTTGGNIISVDARVMSGSGVCVAAVYTNGEVQLLGSPSGNGLGSYATLTTPTGGWTWQKINDLEVKIYGTGSGSWIPMQVDIRVRAV